MVYFAIFLAFLLTACHSVPTPEPLSVEQLVAAHGLDWGERQAGPFHLLSLSGPRGPAGAPLHIYLGGDGQPWREGQPAANPTGRRPLALELMVQDSAPAVYLGRPCYHQASLPAACRPELWTGGRYSPAVLEPMVDALLALVRERTPGEVVLIGYSGGGALAALAAPRLADMTSVSLITLAANLDTAAWTAHHRLLPLATSLNPARQPPSGLPEVHLLGEEDAIVPAVTVKQYGHQHPQARFLYLTGFDHRCCWVQAWPTLLPYALAARYGDGVTVLPVPARVFGAGQ